MARQQEQRVGSLRWGAFYLSHDSHRRTAPPEHIAPGARGLRRVARVARGWRVMESGAR